MYFFKPKYWMVWLKMGIKCASQLVWPTLITFAASMLLLALPYTINQARGSDGIIEASALWPGLLMMGACLIAAGILALIGTALWVYRSIVIMRAYLDIEPDEIDQIHQALMRAKQVLTSHKGYLLKTALIALAISSPLSLINTSAFMLLFFCQPDTISQYTSTGLIDTTVAACLSGLGYAAASVFAFTALILSNYSVATLAIAGFKLRDLKSTTLESLKLTWSRALMLSFATAVASVFLGILSLPQMLGAKYGLGGIALGLVWQHATGLVTVPMVVMMVAESLRKDVAMLKVNG
jgi:hypothetical protein